MTTRAFDKARSHRGQWLENTQTQELSQAQGLGKIQIQRISQGLLLMVVMVVLLPKCLLADDNHNNNHNNNHNHDMMANIQKCMIALSNPSPETTTTPLQTLLTRPKPASSFAIIQSISSHNPPADFDSASAIMRYPILLETLQYTYKYTFQYTYQNTYQCAYHYTYHSFNTLITLSIQRYRHILVVVLH